MVLSLYMSNKGTVTIWDIGIMVIEFLYGIYTWRYLNILHKSTEMLLNKYCIF